MDERAALLRAVAANPDEDTPRLIYADWLDEHVGGATGHQVEWAGQLHLAAGANRARAEFIRVQCELASGRIARCKRTNWMTPRALGCHPTAGWCRCSWCAAARREQTVSRPYLSNWTVETVGRVIDPTGRTGRWRASRGDRRQQPVRFARGFVEALTLNSHDYLTHAGQLFVLNPLREVWLRDVSPAALGGQASHGWCDAGQHQEVVEQLREVGQRNELRQFAAAGLPTEIFALLRGGTQRNRGGITWRVYSTMDKAIAALSAALVAHGRAKRDELLREELASTT